VLFGGAIGAFVASAWTHNDVSLSLLLGIPVGAAVVFLFGLMEDRARAANQRILLGVVRTVRTLTKGVIGALGVGALALTIAVIYLLQHPITPSSPSTSAGNTLGQAIGAALANVFVAGFFGLLGALIGLVVGLIVGAIVEFTAPPTSKRQ
jgi:hypothetical protein